MKQRVTATIDRRLLKRARAIAAHRGTSISGLLTQELVRLTGQEQGYSQAKRSALAYLEMPVHLGGAGTPDRQALHERFGRREPQDDTLTGHAAKGVRHALKQVREGETVPWARVKDELGL